MTAPSASVRTVREPVSETIRRLEVFVARMEHRYECKSADMLRAMKRGEVRETAEVGRWLIEYQTLIQLRGQCGATTGSPTNSTR